MPGVLERSKTVNLTPSKRTSPPKVASQMLAVAGLDYIVHRALRESVVHSPLCHNSATRQAELPVLGPEVVHYEQNYEEGQHTEGKRGRISHYIVVENTQEGSGIKENSASRATLWMPLPGMLATSTAKAGQSIPARDVGMGCRVCGNFDRQGGVEEVYPEARRVVVAAAGYRQNRTPKREQVYPQARPDVSGGPHTA